MKINNKTILFSILLFFFILYSYSFNQYSNKIFYTPDENMNLYISKIFSNSGNLYFKEDLNNNLDMQLIHPRGTFPYNDKLLSIWPFGGPIIWGTLLVFNLENIIQYFTPL